MKAKADVLLVDDDVIELKLLDKFTSKLGLESVFAVDGQHALKTLSEYDVSWIITDISMPFVDGLEFINQMRLQSLPSVSIVAISSDESYKDACMALGVEHFFTKPVDFDALAELLSPTS